MQETREGEVTVINSEDNKGLDKEFSSRIRKGGIVFGDIIEEWQDFGRAYIWGRKMN